MKLLLDQSLESRCVADQFTDVRGIEDTFGELVNAAIRASDDE